MVPSRSVRVWAVADRPQPPRRMGLRRLQPADMARLGATDSAMGVRGSVGPVHCHVCAQPMALAGRAAASGTTPGRSPILHQDRSRGARPALAATTPAPLIGSRREAPRHNERPRMDGDSPGGIFTPPLISPQRTIGRRTFDFARQVAVMAIVNRTPDSFHDHGRTYALDHAVQAVTAAANDG